MLILGLNAFHADSAACIVRDGRLLAAVEEERFRRIKHWSGFPAEAIGWCLKEAGASLADVDLVAINQDSKAHFWKRSAYLAKGRASFELVTQRLKNRKARRGIDALLAEAFPDSKFAGKIIPIEHHMAHLSSAFHVSPFENAIAVSVDGFGDFASAAWGVGRGTGITVDKQVFFPDSLGILYQALTQFLGFHNYGDEYKVMGLAPYGEPRHLDALHNLIAIHADGTFRLDPAYFVHSSQSIAHQWENGSPTFDMLFRDRLEDLLGPRRTPGSALEQRHMDLARSVQALYELAFLNILRSARRDTGLTDVVLAGGCANNSVANGKIRRETPFERVYVHAAPGDQGGAIGAAFAAWHRQGGERGFTMDHAYWGPAFGREACRAAIDLRRADVDDAGCTVTLLDDEAALCVRTAAAVAEGKVVGWFQGRMEWGPRALGNRSIIGDPRRADMKDILNAKIKRRESFRPFAPSILAGHVAEWFEEDDDVPFMMQVFQIREDKRSALPAVTHRDGSGRLQTVHSHANPRYFALISAFHALTGVPVVLNTSFNENEPIVCQPGEALDCFLRTKMDVLVLGEYFVERGPG